MMTTTKGILLVNLGSPKSPSIPDVRAYLKEFLLDKYVIDYPAPLRELLVRAFILPIRPKHSAHAYQSIWWEAGSPLIVLSLRLQAALQTQTPYPVALGMRYGSPSIAAGLQELAGQGAREILLIPLYPQYAMSTTLTVTEQAQKDLAKIDPGIMLTILPPFYQHPDYINALVESAQTQLAWEYDHLLFSYHGVPERQLRKTDPTGQHCLANSACCETPSPAHATCYRHQAFQTTAAFVRKAGIPDGRYSQAFQSRLGRDVWLQPATAERIAQLGAQGVKKLLVICPSFVTDCLETLEEIEIGGAESFRAAGGDEFRMIPCLNTHPAWVQALANWSAEQLSG